MAAHVEAHLVHACSRQLWHQVCRQRTCLTLTICITNLLSYQHQLDWQPLHRHPSRLGLRTSQSPYLHARVMPGYVAKALQQFQHKQQSEPQHSPFPSKPIKYGSKNNTPLRPPMPPLWTNKARNSSNKFVENSYSLAGP